MHRKASMLCMLAALLSFGSAAFAQEQTVSIQGVVKDASGAVLPGATVEARNPLAGTNTAVTNADGVYRFPALPPASTKSRPHCRVSSPSSSRIPSSSWAGTSSST